MLRLKLKEKHTGEMRQNIRSTQKLLIAALALICIRRRPESLLAVIN